MCLDCIKVIKKNRNMRNITENKTAKAPNFYTVGTL